MCGHKQILSFSGNFSREGALRPFSLIFQPTREVPAPQLSTPDPVAFPASRKAGLSSKAGPSLIQGDQNFSELPEISSHQARDGLGVSHKCAGL